MKLHNYLLLALVGSAPLKAQTLAPAALIDDGEAKNVWIQAANERTIRYLEDPRSVNRTDVRASSVTAFIYTPPEFEAALTDFENRDYKKALEGFTAAREKYKFTDAIPGNFSTLAGYYELECDRHLQDWKSLQERLKKFIAEPLELEAHKTQVAIYPLYEAVSAQDWSRLLTLCAEWDGKLVPASVRAQIGYCSGLAYEGLQRWDEALMAFNVAFVADYTASEVITREAALGCFRVYNEMPEVILAKKLHGTPDENPNLPGAFLLTEAAALVELWETALGRGAALPAEFKAFSKYKKA